MGGKKPSSSRDHEILITACFVVLIFSFGLISCFHCFLLFLEEYGYTSGLKCVRFWLETEVAETNKCN